MTETTSWSPAEIASAREILAPIAAWADVGHSVLWAATAQGRRPAEVAIDVKAVLTSDLTREDTP